MERGGSIAPTTVLPTVSPTFGISNHACDDADRYNRRQARHFNESEAFGCVHPGYHSIYYDDLVNTFVAAVNILSSLNMTFIVTQGTLLSMLRHQPILPWDHDADIYIFIEQEAKNDTSIDVGTMHTSYSMAENGFENTNDEYDPYEMFDVQWYDEWFSSSNHVDTLYEKLKNATQLYESNAVDKGLKYQVQYHQSDASNIFRFMKKEAIDWGCTGYTDLYVITTDAEYEHLDLFNGNGEGSVPSYAQPIIDRDCIFPIVGYSDYWVPHWKMDKNEWNGEMLEIDKIPIPGKPHKWAALYYPNHMIPDNDGGNLTCTLRNIKL